jgi:hypothetical protein
MGNANYGEGWSTEGWQWNHNKFNTEAQRIPFWFKRILSDEDFRIELRERWAEHRSGNLSDESLNNKIDSLATLLSEAEVRNNQAWRIWTRDFWPNYYLSRSFADEINFLRTWLTKRIAWMDDQFSPYPSNLVANSSFDSDLNRNDGNNNAMLSNWLTTTSDIGLSTTVKHNGIYALSFRGTGDAWQTITELAEDNYTLKAWVRTVDTPASEIIVGHYNTNGSEIKMQIEPSDDFYEITIDDIEVNTGICEIAFQTSISDPGDTRLYVDSVSFVRQFDTRYKYHPDYIENNHCVYPNPFDDKVIFEFTPKDDKCRIFIYSLSGTLIDLKEVNADKDIKTSIYWTHRKKLPAGLYFYKIINGYEQINGKLIKSSI